MTRTLRTPIEPSRRTDRSIDAPLAFATRAARRGSIPDDVENRLLRPERTTAVTVPLERDDGSVEIVDGVRVRHDDARGPALGPLRYRPDVDADTCAGLASALTWTAAVADVPFGGGAGGVAVDPAALSRDELDRLTRAYADRIADDVGPHEDVLASGAGADERTMAQFVDAVAGRVDGPHRATVVDKPPTAGGAPGTGQAAGRSVALAAQEALEAERCAVDGATVAVYGYGAVGATAARLLESWGATVVAACDERGGVADPDGLDTVAVPDRRDRSLTIPEYDGAAIVGTEDVLARDVDVLVAAAPGETITAENAPDLEAGLVVEGTYGGVSPDGQDALTERDVPVVPDVLANVGSVVASHLEWVQSAGRDRWTEARVRNELGYAIVDAWEDVRARREADDLTWRAAAYDLALARVVETHEVYR